MSNICTVWKRGKPTIIRVYIEYRDSEYWFSISWYQVLLGLKKTQQQYFRLTMTIFDNCLHVCQLLLTSGWIHVIYILGLRLKRQLLFLSHGRGKKEMAKPIYAFKLLLSCGIYHIYSLSTAKANHVARSDVNGVRSLCCLWERHCKTHVNEWGCIILLRGQRKPGYYI